MQLEWWITYEIVTPESAENGDVEENGFVDECGTQWPLNCCGEEAAAVKRSVAHTGTLRDLIDDARLYGVQFHPDADWAYSWPSENYRTGEATSYALHLPRSMPARNVARVARLINSR